jgi:FkbM family methyltransferase
MTVAALIRVGPVTVRLISEGDRIVLSFKNGRGPFEPDTLAKWAELCANGGTVIDGGCYTGLFTISARLMGCRAIAFEPFPVNRARARENARLNGVGDEVNQEALSDRVGDAVLGHSAVPFTSGASLLRRTGGQLPVRTITVDSLKLTGVAAIKLDIERGEPLALAGARETLARCRPPMLIEVLGEAEGKAVLDVIGDLYEVAATLDRRNWLLLPRAR